ncbi:MAG: Holliday junction resolvase RuvX [Ignavibacteriae bacterium]|nr:Holliday junction resolvase RuvX [Ignavibacteriota bacterium]
MDLLKDTSERILSIDYGEKRIGIAISDPLKLFAIPLTTLENNSTFWKELKKIFHSYHITIIVLGYPLREDGTKSKSTLAVEKFEKELTKKIKLPIELVDERYSSSIAQEQIIESVKSKKKRRNKALIDMNAAAVILSDYLNSN